MSSRSSSCLPWLVFGVLVVAPRPALGQCNYPFLTSGSSAYYTQGIALAPTVVQQTNYWTAVAIRPDVGSDWDLGAFQTATTYPACVTNQLASSALGNWDVDLIVGDFNHNPFGSYYFKLIPYAGSGGVTVEWDDGSDILGINAPRIMRSTGPSDVIECWDVFLEAGKIYSIDCKTLGAVHMNLMLFKNPAGAPYWEGRAEREYVLDLPPNSSTVAGLTVDQTDWYGLVMINEEGYSGTYQLQIESCDGSPTPLASTVSTTASEPDRTYSFHQQSGTFAAVGTRSNDVSASWGIQVGEGPSVVPPHCYQTFLNGAEAAGSVAYVVGDFNPGANFNNGLYYARALAPVGTGSSTATVEWDDGRDSIVVNAAPVAGTTGSSDVLRCWNVALQAGNRYQIHFTHGGAANLKLALFENSGGTYWVARGQTGYVEDDTTFFWDADRTDWYGLLLVNDNGAAGNYEVAVNLCVPPIAAQQNAAYGIPATATDGRFELDVAEESWAAAGVRSINPNEDWDLTLYANRFGTPPLCFSNPRASSALGPGVVDVIAGRSNLSGSGPTFWPLATPTVGTTSGAFFEWEQGLEELVVGGPLVTHSTHVDDIVQCWDVDLTLGQTYTIIFEREGAADSKLLLFRANGLLYNGWWRGRSQAELITAGTVNHTATSHGVHGVVVVNDNGGTGLSRIGIYAQGVGVEPTETFATRFEGIRPNPVVENSRIHFAVAKQSEVSFEVINAAGRRVSELNAGTREPGRWSVDWIGTGRDGRRLAAGVYFVRMLVDGLAVQDSRVVQLP